MCEKALNKTTYSVTGQNRTRYCNKTWCSWQIMKKIASKQI